MRTLVLLLLLAPPAWAAEPYVFRSPHLVACHDGDTCTFDLAETHPMGRIVWKAQTIRLLGVDAPELKGKCPEETTLAAKARDRMVALVRGAADWQVRIAMKADGPRREKYGRLLGTVLVDGKDAGAILVAEGLAHEYRTGRRKGWC